MSTLRWYLHGVSARLGLAGWVGLALGLAALLLFVVDTVPRQAHIADQQRRLDPLLHPAVRMASPPPAEDPLHSLPPTGEAAQTIGELEHLARAHDITLPRGQYSVTALTGTSVQRWQLVFPVETDYPALIAWLAAVLERQPNVVLDQLKLKRERIESRTLQAEVRLSLYLGTAP